MDWLRPTLNRARVAVGATADYLQPQLVGVQPQPKDGLEESLSEAASLRRVLNTESWMVWRELPHRGQVIAASCFITMRS